MSTKQQTLKQVVFHNWLEQITLPKLTLLAPLRNWLNQIEFNDSVFAHKVVAIVPAQCPFERKVTLFGKTILSIPPMCKLNPLYEEVVALRFRAICYLADECGEDVSAYC